MPEDKRIGVFEAHLQPIIKILDKRFRERMLAHPTYGDPSRDVLKEPSGISFVFGPPISGVLCHLWAPPIFFADSVVSVAAITNMNMASAHTHR